VASLLEIFAYDGFYIPVYARSIVQAVGADAIAEFDKLPYDITLERLEKIMLLQ
jgi:hypothetical protein